MGAIHVSGSIALFLFGGILLFVGFFAISTCGQAEGWNCAEPWKGYAWLFGGIGMIFGGVVLAMKSSKPAQEKPEESNKEMKGKTLEEYKKDYLANKKKYDVKDSESNFCENCGNSLKPTTKFCGKCGNQV